MKAWSEMSPLERDTLIAEKVMGWQWKQYTWYDGTEKLILAPKDEELSGDDFNWLDDKGQRMTLWHLPSFTTDISAAWNVVDKFAFLYLYKSDWVNVGLYECRLMEEKGNKSKYTALAKSAPEAICLAALKAVGVEIE